MTATVWVLIVLLLSPGGDPTTYEAERRFETFEDWMGARVSVMSVMNALSPDEYIDSWCQPVDVVGIVV